MYLATNRYPINIEKETQYILAEHFTNYGFNTYVTGMFMFAEKDGNKCIIHETETTFTARSAARVASNKRLCKSLLSENGINTPKGRNFGPEEYESAKRFLSSISPAVVKPMKGHKSEGLSLHVTDETFDPAWKSAHAFTNGRVIIEEYFSGTEARYLVVDGKCEAVYEPIIPTLVGNGIHDIIGLTEIFNRIKISKNPHHFDAPIEINDEFTGWLVEDGLDPNHVPMLGEKVALNCIHNSARGSLARNITEEVHNDMKVVIESIGGIIPGLDVYGVDVIAKNHAQAPAEGNYVVLEVNTRPGIQEHQFPDVGKPIDVGKKIAASCIRKMNLEVSGESKSSSILSVVPPGKQERFDLYSERDLERIVVDSAEHLISTVKGNGRFKYAYDLGEMEREHRGYNMLRHCGTVWFLVEAWATLGHAFDKVQADRLKLAVSYAQDHLKEPSWSDYMLPTLCLTKKDIVKVGGSALALIFISRLLQTAPSFLTDDDRVELSAQQICLKNYLVSQSTEAGFIHKRKFSSGAIYDFRSDYYTGQVLFALSLCDGVPQHVRELYHLLFKDEYGVSIQSHWMAYAACSVLQSGYCDKRIVINYLNKLMANIVSDQNYLDRAESTPIAVRSEALVQFLNTIGADDDLRSNFEPKLINLVEYELIRNLDLQYTFYSNGQFQNGVGNRKVQIDYIQHNAAAYLGALGYLRTRNGET